MSTIAKIRYIEDITMEELVQCIGLSYGVLKPTLVLEEGQIGKYVVMFDKDHLGRGFEAKIDEYFVSLCLPFPAGVDEIELFYDCVLDVCRHCGQEFFLKNDQRIPVSADSGYVFISRCIEQDMEESKNCLKHFMAQINDHSEQSFTMACARHPLTLGAMELGRINEDLEEFGDWLDMMQKSSLHYTNLRIYKRNEGTMFGVYSSYVEEKMVYPIDPEHFSKDPNVNIDSYFVALPDGCTVSYDDFLEHAPVRYFDAGHVHVTLDEDAIDDLISGYNVEPSTGRRKTVHYLGDVVDDGPKLHCAKIKEHDFGIDEIAGFNHMAIFLRFMIDHGLVEKWIMDECPRLDTMADLRYVIRDHVLFNGRLRRFHFNEEGREFVKKYYDEYCDAINDEAKRYFAGQKFYNEEMEQEAYLFRPYGKDYETRMFTWLGYALEEYMKEKQDGEEPV